MRPTATLSNDSVFIKHETTFNPVEVQQNIVTPPANSKKSKTKPKPTGCSGSIFKSELKSLSLGTIMNDELN